MGTAISIDGVLLDPAHAAVPVLDRGFLYGDSAFEVLRTYSGRVFAMDAHLSRLNASCEKIGIPLVDERALASEIAAALAAAKNDESYIRVVITRGVTAIGIAVGEPVHARRVIVVLSLPEQSPELYEKGVAVATVAIARSLDGTGAAGAKASNYLPNILSLEAARKRGAYEAIAVASGGELLEGTTSNLFLVRGGRVLTPPLSVGILGGITRRVVIEAAGDERIAVEERLLFPPDLYRAEEAFITSTLREVIPVVSVDGLTLGDGDPGELTKRLHRAFRRRADAMLARV